MEIETASSRAAKKAFAAFAYDLYRDTPAYRDNLNYACDNFLYQRDAFARACRIRPVLVRERGAVMARCAYIAHPGLDAAQMALFEARPGKRAAVDALLDGARAFAAEQGLKRLLLGVNGHSSYGLGFQTNRFDQPNPFDSVYTPEYYLDYFRGRGFREHGVSSYYVQISRFAVADGLLRKIYGSFRFRTINLRRLRAEMDILGPLFNETLRATPFFFPRPVAEWYELFRSLRPILNDANILFVMKDGKEAGFLFWHPNYNMALRGNRRNRPLTFLLRYLLRRRAVTEIKINALGVLPAYRNSGAVVGLFHELQTVLRGRYHGGESGFVFDGNLRSAALCRRLCGQAHRRFVVFETETGV